MASHATARAVKFAFRAELGWYAIAYYPQDRPKTGMKEYGRFTVASVDRDRHLYVITLFDPDYKGAYKARVPNPPRPNDLNGKKKAATIELQVHGQQLLATVKDANSDRVSFSPGDTFQMASREEFTGPVNLGNPVEFTIAQLADQVIRLTNSKSKIIRMPLPPDDPTQRQPDISLAKKELNWEPHIPLEDGLKKTISFFESII